MLMTTAAPHDTPAPDELADARDQEGWNRDVHGTFADHAAPDDAVQTVEAEAYLTGPGG
jgi:hypothetical protein